MRKSIALLLVLAMTLTFPELSMAKGSAKLSDNEKGLLNALSLINEEGISENEFLTRGEFAEVICKVFGWQVFADDSVPFQDIDSTHPHFGAISTLYSRNVIKGYTKYSVAPNNPVTLDEAAVMAVTALGYNAVCDTGEVTYYAKAHELGIYDGISVKENRYLTEETAERIMYNILFAPIMSFELNANGSKYFVDDNKTVLSQIYDVYEIKGVVKENGFTSLFGISSLAENEIKIDNNIYLNSSLESKTLLGQAVIAYITETDDKEYSVIYAYSDEHQNTTVNITTEQIVSADKNYVEYDADKNVKTLKMSPSVEVVYNGIGVKNITDSYFNPVDGELTLIDNNNDGLFDVVFTTEYRLVVTESAVINSEKIEIFDKLGNDISVKTEDSDITVYMSGNSVPYDTVKSGMVLLIADSGANQSKRIINIYILEGIEGILNGGNDEYVTIGTDKRNASQLLATSTLSSMIGKNVVAYANRYNEIVYVSLTSGNVNYGYLYKASLSDDGERILIKFMDTENEWHTLNLAEKVKCNDRRMTDDDMYLLLSNPGGLNDTNIQLIRYQINSENEVSRLDLAVYREGEDGYADLDFDAKEREKGNFRKSMLKRKRGYAHTMSGMHKTEGASSWLECFFDSSVKVLLMPDPAGLKTLSTEDMRFTNSSYFGVNMNYVCEGFDLTENNRIPIVVVYSDPKPKVSSSERVVVVDRVDYELDENEEIIEVLYGWYMGTYQKFTAVDENSFKYNKKPLKCGDVVRLAMDDKGRVSSMEDRLWFRVDDNPEQYFTTYVTGDLDSSGKYSVAYGYHQTAIGKVDKVYGDFLRIEINNGKFINVKMNSSVAYVHYDSESKNHISKGSMNNVRVGDYVVAKLYFSTCKDIITYSF